MKYIGLDIGDGESAATLVLEHGTLTPQVLTLGAEQSILSVVAMQGKQPVVGSAALTGYQVTERSARFKSRFLSTQDPQDLRRFAAGIYHLMSQTAQHALNGNPDEIRVALGCPAGWSELERSRYAAIVAGAGFPHVHTVSESRAAFLYVHYDQALQITTQSLQKPCLVIDIGSSTTDFAYIVGGRESNVGVFGQNHLGGGLIDRLILKDAVESCKESERLKLNEIFEKYPSWYSRCELEARKRKEEYFTGQAEKGSNSVTATTGVFLDPNNPIYIRFALDDARMERLLDEKMDELEGVSFRQALNDALKKAQQHTAHEPPEWLILTGGASRMNFFREACKEAFPNASILICPQPEFSIARGLGIAARTDHQLACFREELRRFFEGDDLAREVEQSLSKLKNELTAQMAEIVLQHGFMPAAQLAVQDGQATPESFLQNVNGYMQDFMQDEEKTAPVQATIQKWVADSLTQTQEKVNAMCAKYGVDPAAINLSSLPFKLDLSGLKLPWLFSRVLALIGYVPTKKRFGAFILNWLQKLMLNARHRANLHKAIQEDLFQDGMLASRLSTRLTQELRNRLNKHIAEAEIMIQ